MYDDETKMKIQLWEQKQAQGTLTVDECKEFIAVLRGGRMTAAAASKSAAKKPPVNVVLPEI